MMQYSSIKTMHITGIILLSYKRINCLISKRNTPPPASAGGSEDHTLIYCVNRKDGSDCTPYLYDLRED